MACSAAGDVLVLEVDLVIEERHDQTSGSTTSSALLPLVAADGVVTVNGTLALLVQSAQDSVSVVREEASLVQDGAQAFGACIDRHGLVVAVSVHLADGVQALLQGLAVGCEPNDREQDVGIILGRGRAANLEDFRGVSGVDAVARRETGVTCQDGEVVAGDGKG
jgi:hypothetical protein